MPDENTPLGLFDLADIPLRKVTLELPRICQTTRDAKLVASGIWVYGYCCPLCSTGDDDYGDGDYDYSREGHYACCFSWCGVGDHAVEDSDYSVCSRCDGCSGDCCDCYHCEHCGDPQETVCDRCDYCESCCPCSHCEYCSAACESTCSNCSNCESHCECYWCSACGEATESACGECDYCDECCTCSQCPDGGDCEAPHLAFLFPANGKGTIREDERIEVTLPAGTIDEEGLEIITLKVMDSLGRGRALRYSVRGIIHDEVGPLWQAKRGNFTRRLSSVLHKHGVKLEPGILSEVGNLARQHSSDTASWFIEVTRDLNQSASAFYHSGSCWFGGDSYGQSRCCLKAWGGMGIRSFASMDDEASVTGRAWIQPLTDSLKPTHETVEAHAFAIYNGYGDLDGYIATRIVAYLTSRSYKKVSIHAGNQYINGDSGYLVAEEATCASTESVSYDYENHDTLDAYKIHAFHA